MQKKTETQLISDYLEGNENSFRDLVSLYVKPIYSFSFRMTGNKTDSEDITQEVFIKVWKNIEKFNIDQDFKTWIFTIARNTIFDWLRKKKDIVFSNFENDEGDNYLVENISDKGKDPEEIFYDKEKSFELGELLKKISKYEQEIIFLKNEDDLTFEEISKIVGKPLNTVKSQYRRALVKLRNLINAPK